MGGRKGWGVVQAVSLSVHCGIHAHKCRPSNPNTLTHLLSRNLPLPKYFSSPPSFALYRLPRKNPHAFQQAIGTAAGKAGVTSLRVNPDAPDEELSERFVVGWVEVDAEPDIAQAKETPVQAEERRPSFPGGIGMGTREDRRSFGSEDTSRTVTPTPARFERDTPTPPGTRKSSSTITTNNTATKSNLSGTNPNTRPRGSSDTIKHNEKERQLVAITYAGDWYRLKIPASDIEGESEMEEDDKIKKGRCQLVEYRRLGVGGGGW
jgi:hypothetical protein